MAGADRVQIILEVKDELSKKIARATKDLNRLKATEADMAKSVVAGNKVTAASYDAVHDEVIQLEAALSKLREERKILGAQERAEARKAVQDEIDIREQIKRREAAIVSLTRRIDGITNVVARQRRGWDLLSARIGRAAATFKARWTSAIASVQARLTKFQNKLKSAATSGLARYGTMAAGMLGGVVTMTGLKTASMLEQTGIAFEVILGSAKEAKKMTEWLAQTTLETPFQLEGLTHATQRLLAFGFGAEEARKHLITIGDAAAATGMGAEGIERISLALGQMQGKQKIQSQEMRQLTEAGIPAWEMLADKMGMTVAELMAMSESKGGGAEIFSLGGLDMLFGALNERYGGLMERQIDTLGGRWSNLMDALALGSAAFLKDSGLAQWLKDFMEKAATWITETFKSLTKWAMRAAVRLRPVYDTVKKIWEWLEEHKGLLGDIALGVGVFVAALWTLVKVFAAIKIATMAFNTVMAILNGTLYMNPIVWIVLAIAALIAALVLAYKKVDWFRNAVDAAWEWIQKAVAWFVDWFKTYAWPVIRTYLKFWWGYMKNVVWPVLKWVFQKIWWVIKLVWAYISKVWWPGVRMVFRAFIAIGRAAWAGTKIVWNKIVDIFTSVKTAIGDTITSIKDFFKGLWTGLTEGLPEAVKTMSEWLAQIPGLGGVLNKMLFAGGPVNAGDRALVGEIGPELFVPNGGMPQIVGQHGPEIRDFHQSGMVIPNHLLVPAMAGQAAPAAAPAPTTPGVHIEHLTVQDRFDARREFEALMAKQQRIAAERN